MNEPLILPIIKKSIQRGEYWLFCLAHKLKVELKVIDQVLVHCEFISRIEYILQGKINLT
jgi:hypothetical protein